MLHHAYYWRERVPGSLVSRYVRGWGRPGDTAVIALENGFPVGAAWFRVFGLDEPGYGFVDERTPERRDRRRPTQARAWDRRRAAARADREGARRRRTAEPERRAGEPGPQALRTARSVVDEGAEAWTMVASL